MDPENLASFEAMEEAHPPEPPLPPDSAVLPCQSTWVAVELLDAAGQPVAAAEYVLTLPDGSERRGRLDEAGYAIERNVPEPGRCRVRFPNAGAVRPR